MNKGKAYDGDSRLAKTSKYIRCYLLQGKEWKGTIAKAQIETVQNQGGEEHKMLVLYFEGGFKGRDIGLGLNNTNIDSITAIMGTPVVKDWIGKSITLCPTTCQAFGKKVECVRIG